MTDNDAAELSGLADKLRSVARHAAQRAADTSHSDPENARLYQQFANNVEDQAQALEGLIAQETAATGPRSHRTLISSIP